MKVEPSYHFSTTLKGKIFFHPIILRHQNTKTVAYMLSKNHWVRPFFAFFRFVREILFVTVALDHPVVGFQCEHFQSLIYCKDISLLHELFRPGQARPITVPTVCNASM